MAALGGSSGRRYPVVFREQGKPSAAGSLEVAENSLRLAGTRDGGTHKVEVELADIDEVRIGRRPEERINGYPTVVLERRELPAVEVAPLGATLLHEIADLLAQVTEEAPGSADVLTVYVPLKPGCSERAGQLLAQGPPLEPSTLGVTEHYVYLRDREAIFVFQGPGVQARIGQAMRSPVLWRAGLAWRDCIAGRPRIDKHPPPLTAAETPFYRWTAPPQSPGPRTSSTKARGCR